MLIGAYSVEKEYKEVKMILGIDYRWFLTGLIFIVNVASFFAIRRFRVELKSAAWVLVICAIIGFLVGGLTLQALILKSSPGFWLGWSAWSIIAIIILPLVLWTIVSENKKGG